MTSVRWQVRVLAALMLLALPSAALHAQTVTGTLSGSVSDSSGAALPGVTITIRNAETGLERVVTTTGEGFFNAPFLPVGRYNVSAELAGLGSARRQNVPVNLNESTRQDFVIDPQVAESITVNADAPRINVSDGEVKQTMRETEIMTLPSQNQTSFLSLASAFAGYNEHPGQFGSGVSADMSTLSTGSSVMFNGTGTRGTSFQINGVNNDDSSENQHRQGVALATIKSFQILSNSFSAEFGRGYGAVVLVQTKSGTNDIAGETYGYFKNGQWNSKNILSRNLPLPKNHRRQFGATAGFPIIQDQLFAFFNADTVDDGGEQIFTRALWLPTDLASPRLTLGNDTPENRAFQDALLARFPTGLTPNSPNLHARAYQYPQIIESPQRDYSGRLDWNATPSNSVTARYQRSNQKVDRVAEGELIRGELVVDQNRQSNFGLTWTNTLSSNTVQEARLGLGMRRTRNDIGAGNDTPVVRFAGITNGTILGNANAFPIDRDQTDQQFVYNISSARWTGHTLKLGTDIRRSKLDDYAADRNRGFWSFSASCGGVSYPTAFAAFMAGCVATHQRSFGPVFLENDLDENNFYVQDDWRPTDNLVLNLGARYEMVGAAKERENRIDYRYEDNNYIDPRLGFAYTPEWADNRFLRSVTGGNGRFSIRGGFGVYHGRVFQSIFSQGGASVRFNPPNGISITATSATNLADPTNGFVYDPSRPLTTRISITSIDPDLQMPETRQWNLTLERQMLANSRLRLSYIGTLGKNLLQYRFDNLPVIPGAAGSGAPWVLAADPNCAGTGLPGAPINATCPVAIPIAANEVSLRFPRNNERRPDARYTTNLIIDNLAQSSYHGGQMEWETGVMRGFQSRLTYTYAKALDTGSEATFSGAGDINMFPDNEKFKRGPSRFDVRHRASLTASYLLPFFKDRNDWVNLLLGGWQLSTLIRYSSGTPFTIVDSGAADIDFDGVTNLRPVVVDPQYSGGWSVNYPGTSQVRLPRNAFRRARVGDTLEDLIGRNTYTSDGQEQIDLGIYKTFKMPFGGDSLVLRFDVFNVVDHVTWGYPTNDFASANFGRITTAFYTPRTLQLGLRYIY